MMAFFLWTTGALYRMASIRLRASNSFKGFSADKVALFPRAVRSNAWNGAIRYATIAARVHQGV
ncbi:hypothetical protein A6768_04010 [Sphingobium yanoikuyae]|uniref:Uncharacterized protein n=2 Tax=Sphingobium yanoikuyae TaxID=13690 RepID=A0A291N7A8_SPHYA|nr:hypothetical protein A6768_04010 [Sphingobium yanoikuyae]